MTPLLKKVLSRNWLAGLELGLFYDVWLAVALYVVNWGAWGYKQPCTMFFWSVNSDKDFDAEVE